VARHRLLADRPRLFSLTWPLLLELLLGIAVGVVDTVLGAWHCAARHFGAGRMDEVLRAHGLLAFHPTHHKAPALTTLRAAMGSTTVRAPRTGCPSCHLIP